ncbi:multidrug efflux SMR transporter [Helicobacter sp. MIT 03-1614]|jgi:spermidine export protein MdtI|uniref:Spermidine export protein MdtI n=1 Tax=Helicobacter hepaticus (strain ATCC 51449 / 3B1) TaxID=235279 RepID=Q7VIU6_HELHP|nr:MULTISPECIES: multidrug efflux SMR transporter [Helicobacter]AAP77105.1 predicted efflux protein [Helicobacter hepaticus ATCC 51449]TLD89636.1 multidrug efflux SMR transporter [Helicobacter sp. MIT 03-1614]
MTLAFIYVIISAILDVIANLFLKKSNVFTHKGYTIGCILMVWAAFSVLVLALESMPLSVAYSTWGAIGIIGTIFGGYVFFKEKLDFLGYIGVAMVVCGVILLHWES